MDIEALTGLVAVTLGIMVVLVPVIGITARFALKPIVDAFARVKEKGEEQKVALMEQRIALLEEHLHSIDRNLGALQEDADFRRQLDSRLAGADHAVRGLRATLTPAAYNCHPLPQSAVGRAGGRRFAGGVCRGGRHGQSDPRRCRGSPDRFSGLPVVPDAGFSPRCSGPATPKNTTPPDA